MGGMSALEVHIMRQGYHTKLSRSGGGGRRGRDRRRVGWTDEKRATRNVRLRAQSSVTSERDTTWHVRTLHTATTAQRIYDISAGALS